MIDLSPDGRLFYVDLLDALQWHTGQRPPYEFITAPMSSPSA